MLEAILSGRGFGVHKVTAWTGGSPTTVTMAPASLELGYGLTAVAQRAPGDMVARGISVLTDWGPSAMHE